MLASLQSKSWSNAYTNKQHLAAMHLNVTMIIQDLSLLLFWHNNSIWKNVFYPCQPLSKNFIYLILASTHICKFKYGALKIVCWINEMYPPFIHLPQHGLLCSA